MTMRRLKTYTGAQGFVYQYYFIGKRPGRSGSPAGEVTEYVFDVTSDRKSNYEVRVLLPQEVIANWARVHGRALSDTEQYAGVKMRLFRAFDEIENMQRDGSQLRVDLSVLEELLLSLGVE